ncbi:MAG: transglutaminase family protein [Candidatus Bathyarchaeota archaeon]|nr:transglutaminase family protein [Candidatus Bathyarchaeota archaeon]
MRLRGEVNLSTDQERMDKLAELIEEGSQSPVIREFTLNLLNAKGVKSYDYLGEIEAIFEWVRDNITYRRHVLCRDSFTTAERTLKLRSGDCDNCVVLLNSMLASVGIPVGARIVSSSQTGPFHHIYSLAGVPPSDPKRWIPLDPTEKSARVGWEPAYAKRRDYQIVCEV